MKINKWKLEAQKFINNAIRQMKEEGVIQNRSSLNDEQKKEFKKRIDDAYPFGTKNIYLIKCG